LQQIIGYDKSLKSGRINPKAEIKTISERPSLIRIDADAAPGQYASPEIKNTSLHERLPCTHKYSPYTFQRF
jgi:LDH2 family malate/lactate/ureidoglycolate dehydrogenase